VRRHARLFWVATCLLYLPALAMSAVVWAQPELIYSLMDPALVGLEEMYEPGRPHIGFKRASDTNVMMFGHYIQNNLSIGFQTFAGGLILGLGSIAALVFNGLYFGTVATHLTRVGYAEPFFQFVAGHSAFELTAIALSGMAGLLLGRALLTPGLCTRREALVTTARVAVRIVYGGRGHASHRRVPRGILVLHDPPSRRSPSTWSARHSGYSWAPISCSWAAVRIEALTLAVRPRLPFEAMDLGLRLIQSHWGAVYTAWAVALVPVLRGVLYASWLWSTLVWWLKPFYDRALVLVLSRAAFGEAMGAGDVTRALPGFFRTGLVRGLTWCRLDPSRSFTLPVWQLEGLRGAARRRRSALLRKGGRQRAMWLTTACIHIEMLLMFAGIALFFMVLPEGVGPPFDRRLRMARDACGRGSGQSQLPRRPVAHRTALCSLRSISTGAPNSRAGTSRSPSANSPHVAARARPPDAGPRRVLRGDPGPAWGRTRVRTTAAGRRYPRHY
jgi:uncharacterized membrane protein SpoIIM required for sporulation